MLAEITRDQLKSIIKEVVVSVLKQEKPPIPVGVSNRHIHLSAADYFALFGNEPFENVKDLGQPGEFASNRFLDIEGPKCSVRGVRILGPFRTTSQVEISNTDARALGIKAPTRLSGNVEGTPGLTLIGPKGRLELPCGVIVAQRHVHMTPDDAELFGVKNGDKLDIFVDGPRPAVFVNTLVRVSNNFKLEMHLDTDEANAVGQTGDMYGKVIEL
ncbi:MAG: phosphate propanoyltransferase [Oscillospiraceae bacterium]